jgi:hypothetical protein
LELLRSWVNPAYLKQDSWAKVQQKMEADGSVQLQKFLLPEVRSYAERGLHCA